MALGVQKITIYRKLKDSGLVKEIEKVGSKYIFSEETLSQFLFFYYRGAYERMRKNGGKLTLEYINDNPIPAGKGTIRKVNDRFYIRSLPIRYTEDGMEFYKGTSFPSKELAYEYREELIRRRNKGDFIHIKEEEYNEKTFVQYCKQFIQSLDVRDGTYVSYMSVFNCKIKPYFEDMLIEDLTRESLQRFINSLTSSIPRTLVVLKMVLTDLYQLELIPKDYARMLKKPKLSKQKEKRALTKEETRWYLDEVKDKPYGVIPIILFMAGLRVGEACALKGSDISITSDSTGYIDVNRTVSLNREGKSTVGETKTKQSVRRVYFHSSLLVEQLRPYLTTDSYLFTSSELTSEVINVTYVNAHFFYPYRNVNGLPKDFSSHYGRVTYASHALANGLSFNEVKDQLGHSTTNMLHSVYGKSVGVIEEKVRDLEMYEE